MKQIVAVYAVFALSAIGCELSREPLSHARNAEIPSSQSPWQTFQGPPDSLSISAVVSGGWGGKLTCELRGRGAGQLTRRDRPSGGLAWDTGSVQDWGKGVSLDSLAYSTDMFLDLLNKFYAADFFNMQETYSTGHRATRSWKNNGPIAVKGWMTADAPEAELSVRLGQYVKTVHFSLAKDIAPTQLGELLRATRAFADSNRVGS